MKTRIEVHVEYDNAEGYRVDKFLLRHSYILVNL